MGYSPTQRITSLNRILELINDEDDCANVIKQFEFPDRVAADQSFTAKLNDPLLYSTYGGKLSKYLLLRIDKEFWDLENFSGYPGTITVEHVLPQTPSINSQWLTLFSEDQRDEWTNRLGNLTLLSSRKNSSAQNFDFATKKSVYFGQKGTAFKITQQLNGYTQWDLPTLKKRHDELLQLARKIFL